MLMDISTNQLICGKGILTRSIATGRFASGSIQMDTTYETALGKSVLLKEKPSYYFKRQCWISGDPDEKALAHIVEHVGNDKFFWATDFPHFDHPRNYLEALQNLVAPLSDTARKNLLGDSVARVYGL